MMPTESCPWVEAVLQIHSLPPPPPPQSDLDHWTVVDRHIESCWMPTNLIICERNVYKLLRHGFRKIPPFEVSWKLKWIVIGFESKGCHDKQRVTHNQASIGLTFQSTSERCGMKLDYKDESVSNSMYQKLFLVLISTSFRFCISLWKAERIHPSSAPSLGSLRSVTEL